MSITFLNNKHKAEMDARMESTENDIKTLRSQFEKPIQEQVDNWLDAHPEATTTVMDGSIVESKINADFLPIITNDFFTPQRFGAVGDGVHDDTEAIRAAVEAAKTGGGTVYLPTGQYLVTGTITVSTNVDIIGTRGSLIIPACDTVFYMKQCSRVSGFQVRILPEYGSTVNTVFLVDQASREKGVFTMNIRFEDILILNLAQEANNNYTIWDIHGGDGGVSGTSNENGFWGVSIIRCSARNTGAVMGYAARIYSYQTDWVSSVLIDGCDTSNFRWHWFFMPSEELALSPDYGWHGTETTITNCAGQWAQGSMGYVYAANNQVLRLFNNKPWDWGSHNNTGCVTPYIGNDVFYRKGNIHTDIDGVHWAQFGILQEDGTVLEGFNGSNWMNRIFGPCSYSLTEAKYVRTYFVGGLQSGDSYKVGAFQLWHAYTASPLNENHGSIRFILMDEYGRTNQVTLTRNAAYVDFPSNKYQFAFNEDYTKAYIVATQITLPRNLFAISIPLTGGMSQRANRTNSRAGSAFSINADRLMQEEVYFPVAPEGLITVPTIVNPNKNVIYSPNGTPYKLSVDDSGTLTVAATTETKIYDIS